MKKHFSTFVGLIYLIVSLSAQSQPFDIKLEALNISGLGGLQAYAFGKHDGKWLIVGGRLDGLHRRQPFAAFDVAGNNNKLIVVDPLSLQKWTAPITSLSVALQEQLSSTNTEFYQQGNYLYVIGGYGYNTATASRKTFGNLTAIDVPAVMNAVIAGTSLVNHFRQIADVQFAVAGGHLKKINNTFYLIGGNKFDGNYNPSGNPTYTQVYTNSIRKFNLSDNGTSITISHLPSITDAVNLHRRDYNAVPQILPDGTEGITAFSGVFQPTVNLPYLNCVNIDSVSYAVNNAFEQRYNHYHCPVLPIYSASNNQMHSVFFGGLAQYYDNGGILVQDDNVPFVKTIARVTRTASGTMTETKLPVEMPSLLGAGAEFISNSTVPQYSNKVLKLDDFTADTTLVGYIYGGISSTAANIFFTNTGTQSTASSQIFKVYVVRYPLLSSAPAIKIKIALNNMTANLVNLANFPLVDPYAGVQFSSSFSHVNNPSVAATTPTVLATSTGNNAIVDWVFIELRNGVSGATSVSYTKAALLQADGDVVDADGVSAVKFDAAPAGNYYIAVRHRNHLGFRTANQYALSGAVTTLDFSNNTIPLFGLTPLGLSNTMIGGAANADGSIDALDSLFWETQNGLFDDYTKNADYNIDGSVDALDSILWETNNGKFQELD
ncbi:MAG: T9SS C-terminal target domain-containing protein [Saprospiraceae bacterium]